MSKQTAMNLYVNDSLRGEAKEISYYLEMEKQQIIKAHGDKYNYSFSQIDPWIVTGEKYYNETYEK